MIVNAVAENVLGTLGTICWTIQLIPQIWKSWRTKDVEGLSGSFVFMWGMAGVTLGVYNITQDLNIPLIAQPELFSFLALVSWGQCQYYGKHQSRTRALLTTIGVMLIFGGLQAGIVFAIRPVVHRGNNRPVQFFGILSAILISLALLPQYWEIFKHKEVIGISITFMIIDLLGGVFSVLSLVFKEKFDILAAISYTMAVVSAKGQVGLVGHLLTR
ncbi:hypothetical protein BDN72DRAFT_600522 [Pluteus cervinus]|uniref:Uncharacterized protein n=1 Tax=Pluteus cervinus TaxID=181527 RepID=A0ACD3BBB0_9AGAR|nr:hypothetical protein BDN72DRAFT_600522 [Pluteus cervinus]